MSETSRTAFAFPGAGVKPCGREADFYRRHERTMKPLLDEASEHARADLVQELVDGGVERLSDARNQCFTYAFGACVRDVLDQRGHRPDVAAGYSFGVYAALYAARSLSFADGLSAVTTAFRIMKARCEGKAAGMAVIIGLCGPDLQKLIERAGPGPLCLVNSSSELSHVVAGPRRELARFCEEADEAGAVSAALLDVEVPYHHPEMLGGASDELRGFLERLEWKEPACPVISSIDQRPLTTSQMLIEFTASNLSTPISWRRVVESLPAMKVGRIIECGPGISLSQNGRFIEGGLEYVNVRNMNGRLGI
jgi:[acyl-carrier-protein] S-malonyltransferase